MLKGKASAAVAVGLRNADVLKNWVVKHQFLSESTIQDMATLILFPSPPSVGIGDILGSRNLIRSQLFNIGVSGRNALQSTDQINPIHH